MEKIYALIKDGIVRNAIVADEKFIQLIAADWDACIRVDELDPRPGVGWGYVGNHFFAPTNEEGNINDSEE